MVAHKSGKKHALIQAKYSLDRIWKQFLLLDIILWIVWWHAPQSPYFKPPKDIYLLITALLFLLVFFLFFAIRNRSWVQARKDAIIVSIPFFKFRISYKFVEEISIRKMLHVYESEKLNWADLKFLKPFKNHAVSTLKLSNFPFPATIIRLFSPNYIYHPNDEGFVFVTDDCALFNSEVDSRLFEFKLQQ
jgi:hypothetical protein